jgi:hypothetical protein
VNQVNNLNLRRESLATAAERSNAYRNARCSVTWLVHTGAHSGSLELEETVRDLQRITGVAANKEWRSDGNVEVKYGVPQFLQVPSLPKDFDFTQSSGDGSFRARLSRTIREPLLRAIDAGHRGAFTVSHGTDAPGLLTMEKFVSALKADLNERQCDLVVLTSVRDPVAHRVGEWIDAHARDEDLFIDRELTTVLQKTPGFPSGEGARLFPQTRALLFAGELQSPDAAAALTARLGRLGKDSSSSERDSSSVNDDLSGVGAKEALEAFQFVDTVAEEVERRVANDSPHATLAGVLTTVDNGKLSARYDLAKSLLAKITQRFVNNFDVVLVAKSDEHEGLRRLAEKLDWRPEALRDPNADESILLSKSIKKNTGSDLADRAFASRDLGGLPLETRRAVNRWGELDGALFVVAEAQKERLKTVEDTNRLGAAFGVMTDADLAAYQSSTRRASPVEMCGDAKRRGVVDAAELVRLSFEKEGGLTHVVRDMQARVKDGKGCLDSALAFLRESDATPVPNDVLRAERGGSYHAAAVLSMEASMDPGTKGEEAYLQSLKNGELRLRGVNA